MGMPTPTNQSNPTSSPQGKGGFQPAQQQMPQPNGGQNGQSQGKGGNVTYPGQGGQPQMGKPNTYSNTVGPWDNASIKPQTQSGKGKGY
jgi:hypothetical protein